MGTGNPIGHRRGRHRLKVYPRGHGESQNLLRHRRSIRGLSPWARGIPAASTAQYCAMRSIPVGTGNPIGRESYGFGQKVYPRGHGESALMAMLNSAADGLSPWARGIPAVSHAMAKARRSIPVGTGNPDRTRLRPGGVRVYPRGHGESVQSWVLSRLPRGLSPWARGIRHVDGGRCSMLGSIPVGTGNPLTRGAWYGRRWVYPRGHGESRPTGNAR